MSGGPGYDLFFKKTINFNFSGQRLQFRVAQDLFSSHDIDDGTRFLLRTVVTSPHFQQPSAILDLGSGYGPLGLTLKGIHPAALVHLTDRDALAVEYAAQNAQVNGLSQGTVAYGCLGYDELRKPSFDLIVSNIPGKAGERVITELLLGAADRVSAGGLVAVVVVSPLESLVDQVLAGSESCEIIHKERRTGHTVYHYRFALSSDVGAPPTSSAIDRGVYNRTATKVVRPSLAYHLETAHGLPEFDTPSYVTELLIDAFASLHQFQSDRALIFNPGQGHLPVAVWQIGRQEFIDLVDRDLLALRYSALNLATNGLAADRISQFHQVGIARASDRPTALIIGILRDDEGPAAHRAIIDQAVRQVSPDGAIIVGGSSTAITRLVMGLEIERSVEVIDRKRRHGQSVLVLKALSRRR